MSPPAQGIQKRRDCFEGIRKTRFVPRDLSPPAEGTQKDEMALEGLGKLGLFRRT